VGRFANFATLSGWKTSIASQNDRAAGRTCQSFDFAQMRAETNSAEFCSCGVDQRTELAGSRRIDDFDS
jgi:hypothetical protein